MRRIKLTIEYDGTAYAGWQKQDNAASVQGEIEKAILKFSQLQQATLYVAGRTDAGVHALGQVAHVDLPKRFSSTTVMKAVNHYLQDQRITILTAEEVSEDFHARFSAKKRKYLYKILNRHSKPSLDFNRVWQVPIPLDVRAMKEATRFLLGLQDFTSFRTVHCQSKSPIRTLDSFDIIEIEDSIQCWVEAPSFLHHQVRNMIGTLVEIGKGRWDADYIKQILRAKDRSIAGPTAPSHGLYFVSVTY